MRIRSLSAALLFALPLSAPFGMSTAYAVPPAQTSTPSSATAGTLSGIATDVSGTALAGVSIALTGPTKTSMRSGADGRYVFSNLTPGLYQVTATKAGFTGTSQADFAVLAGVAATLNVTLSQATLTSLRELGRVTVSSGRSGFNSSPASVAIVSNQTFVDQGQPQVARILNETPGIVSSLPGGVNNASPGAITFPNIRGALSFETAALIDGHPVSVGQYGDYVTTFLNSYILQSVEVIKGPGAASPTISRAIGGTVNFRTIDPTAHPSGTVTLGLDSFGGIFSNFGASGTVGRIGYVADYAVYGTPGPLQNAPYQMALNSGTYLVSDSKGHPISLPAPTVSSAQPPGQYNTRYEAKSSLLFCCTQLNTTYTNKNEVLKLRYKLSDATSISAGLVASQTYSDQNGNNGNRTFTDFTPGVGYKGSVLAGNQSIVDPDNFGQAAHEINNEPLFQSEFRTSLGRDSVLARYYTASISRLQYGVNGNPNGASSFLARVYGGGSNGTPVFNGLDQYGGQYRLTLPSGNDPSGIGGNAYYDSAEEDKLAGYTAEYDHSLGGNAGNVISLSYDANHSKTHSYSFGSSRDSVPAGSTQDTNTLLLRSIFNFNKLNVTLANYLTDFRSHFGVYENASTPQQFLAFQDQDLWHHDERLGLVYRPMPSSSIRLSLGSAVAPPYLGALVASQTPPQLCGGFFTPCPSGGKVAVSQAANPGLAAETSFGYDLGSDYRFRDGVTIATADLYLTNLRNQLIDSTFLNGTATVAGNAGPLPLYTTAYTNVSNARYDGIELGVHREPLAGMGYTLQGALLRAYPYNLSPAFYAGSGGTFGNNLGVVPNINFGSHQTVSNQAIPYSQGYGEISYRSRHGEYLSIGELYYGPNNSLNQHGFLVANATARTTLVPRTKLQVSVDNLFNIFSDPITNEYTGINQPFVNGQFYNSNGNVVGPRNIRVSLTRDFGSR